MKICSLYVWHSFGAQEFFDTDSKQSAELRPFIEKVKKLSRMQFASIETVVDEFLKS